MFQLRSFGQSSNQMLSAVAFTLFAVALIGFISFSIQEYNLRVESEQRNLENAAMGIRLAADSFAIDYRPFFRIVLLVISLLVFLTFLEKRLLIVTFVLVLATLPIIYLWISRVVRDLQFAEYYMNDSPFTLKIATVFDWVVFGLFGVILVWTIRELTSKTNTSAAELT